MIILLYMIIKQKERKREKKEKKTTGTLRYILVLSSTNVHLFEYTSYKDVIIRVLLFTYFKLYFVYIVCIVHGTQ